MIYIFLSLFCYCAVIMISTFATRSVNNILVSAITNVISAILPVLLALPLINGKTVQNGKSGIIASLIAGIFVALFVIFVNKAYAINKVAIVAPIVFGGSIFITAILSYFLFKEKISLFQGIGLTFLALGLAFVTYARLTGK